MSHCPQQEHGITARNAIHSGNSVITNRQSSHPLSLVEAEAPLAVLPLSCPCGGPGWIINLQHDPAREPTRSEMLAHGSPEPITYTTSMVVQGDREILQIRPVNRAEGGCYG